MKLERDCHCGIDYFLLFGINPTDGWQPEISSMSSSTQSTANINSLHSQTIRQAFDGLVRVILVCVSLVRYRLRLKCERNEWRNMGIIWRVMLCMGFQLTNRYLFEWLRWFNKFNDYLLWWFYHLVLCDCVLYAIENTPRSNVSVSDRHGCRSSFPFTSSQFVTLRRTRAHLSLFDTRASLHADVWCVRASLRRWNMTLSHTKRQMKLALCSRHLMAYS